MKSHDLAELLLKLPNLPVGTHAHGHDNAEPNDKPKNLIKHSPIIEIPEHRRSLESRVTETYTSSDCE